MSCDDGCDDHENPCDDCKDKEKGAKKKATTLMSRVFGTDRGGYELPPEPPVADGDPHSWEPTDWMQDRRPEVVSGRGEPAYDAYDPEVPGQQYPEALKSVDYGQRPLDKLKTRKPATAEETELPDDWTGAMFKLPAAVSTAIESFRIVGRHEGNRRRVRISLHPDSTAGVFLASSKAQLPTNTPTAVTDPTTAYGLDSTDGADSIELENRGEVWACSDGSAVAILRVVIETDSPNT